MKRALLTILPLVAATPALAHADGSFHSHGAELFLCLAAIGGIAAIAYRNMK